MKRKREEEEILRKVEREQEETRTKIATENQTTEAKLKIQELREVISARINIEIVKQ